MPVTRISCFCCALVVALAACEGPAEPTAPQSASAAVLAELYGATPLENLILQYQEDGVLNRGLANSLLVKAHAAFVAWEAGAVDAAERRLNAFRAEVASLLAEGVLTQEQADALLGAPVRPLKDLLPGTWAFEGVGFCFNWQVTHGTMTIDWVDREAGTFGGDMTYWRPVLGGGGGEYTTNPILNAHMEPDGAISFSAPYQYQFYDPPQMGTFDGTTIHVSWTANCGTRSDAGGPVVHNVTYTRVVP